MWRTGCGIRALSKRNHCGAGSMRGRGKWTRRWRGIEGEEHHCEEEPDPHETPAKGKLSKRGRKRRCATAISTAIQVPCRVVCAGNPTEPRLDLPCRICA